MWPHLPALPIVSFGIVVGVIAIYDRHLPCGPLRFDLGLASENAIPSDIYSSDALPGSIRYIFRYAPTGTEFRSGVPYWIFRALPRMFPEDFVGAPPEAPWTKFGLVPAPGRATGLPRGMALADGDVQLPGVSIGLRLKRVAFNCAGCHSSEYYGTDGELHEIDGMGNHVADTQAYKRFIYRAIASERFTPPNVIAAINNELVAGGNPPLTFKEQIAYTLLVAAMRDPNATRTWMNARPDNGPGRIDAFNAVKYETLKVPDDGVQNATVDLPSIWNQGPTWRPLHHWDGNTRDINARNYGSVVGVGGSPMSVRGKNVDAVGAWVDAQVAPPPFPWGPRRGDKTDVVRGRAVYAKNCAECHATYDPKTRTLDKGAGPSKLMTNVDVATDDKRWKAFDQATADALNTWGSNLGVWTDHAFQAAQHGYLAGPLDGIWARAPYLHNGSVPTLRALLSPAKARPASFYRGNRHYDPTDMGWAWKDDREDGRRALFRYDTQDPRGGNHNDGHEYLVPDDDVEALLDYLATL